MELQKHQNNQLAQKSVPAACSAELIQCLIKLQSADVEVKSGAKMDLMLRTNELMPAGKPDFKSVVVYPAISQLVQQTGRKQMLTILVLLVKDFCTSVNVVRNMNEDQMIEAGSMLLEECGDFRLEDYVIMFSAAKKGKLEKIKIYDRVDIQLISQIMDQYWLWRKHEGDKIQDEDYNQVEAAAAGSRLNDRNLAWNGSGYSEVKPDGHESIESLQLRLDILKGKFNNPEQTK